MNSCSPLRAASLALVEHLAPLRVAHVLLKERLYLPLAFELRFAFERLPVVQRFRLACADSVAECVRGEVAWRRVLFRVGGLRRLGRALQSAAQRGAADHGLQEAEESPAVTGLGQAGRQAGYRRGREGPPGSRRRPAFRRPAPAGA